METQYVSLGERDAKKRDRENEKEERLTNIKKDKLRKRELKRDGERR